MPNLIKYIETDTQQRARSALLLALYAVAAATPGYDYHVATVCQLIPCDAKTLFNARKKRTLALDTGQPINPLELESIAFVAGRNPTYLAIRLKEYFDRKLKASGMKPSDQIKPGNYQTFAVGAVLGFQKWLNEAGPREQWAFAMQKGGRPMDLIAATLSNQVTDDIRWLTIREFGEVAAHAASQTHANAEQQELEDQIKVPVKTKELDRIERWNQPGEPV